jgi:hypothetical protein
VSRIELASRLASHDADHVPLGGGQTDAAAQQAAEQFDEQIVEQERESGPTELAVEEVDERALEKVDVQADGQVDDVDQQLDDQAGEKVDEVDHQAGEHTVEAGDGALRAVGGDIVDSIPGSAAHTAPVDNFVRGLAMTDIEFFEERDRLLLQRLCDAEREIEDLKNANERQACDRENERRLAPEFGDYERPEVVAKALEPILRRWPRERRQGLAHLITRI